MILLKDQLFMSQNKEILIVVANEKEKDFLIAEGWNSNHLPIKVIGEGFPAILSGLKGISKKTKLINFGFVGSDNFETGTRVQIKCVKMFHPNCKIYDPCYLLPTTYDEKVIKSATCYTSDGFVLKNETGDKKAVFDMELYYLLALGYKVIYADKVVSDNLNYKEYKKGGN